MKDFSTYDIYKQFTHSQKKKVLEYLELMYSISSPFQKIDSPEEKRSQVLSRLHLQPEDMMETDALKELAFHYISFFQQNNKFQNLLMFRKMFLDFQKLGMNDIKNKEGEDLTKELTAKGKIIDLCESLEEKIDLLMKALYPEELKEQGLEQLKVRTMETRLKEKPKLVTN